jgi:hypothetical protein
MIAELAVTRVWDTLLIRWFGWEWDGIGASLRGSFVIYDHTL